MYLHGEIALADLHLNSQTAMRLTRLLTASSADR
jgi:hypothetical protein